MKGQHTIGRDEQGHIISNEKDGYNERLFRPGIRRNYHEARFHSLHRQFRQRRIQMGTNFELGCFDARTIRFIPFRPEKYLGYDVYFENGSDLARRAWDHEPGFKFNTCQRRICLPTLKRF